MTMMWMKLKVSKTHSNATNNLRAKKLTFGET